MANLLSINFPVKTDFDLIDNIFTGDPITGQWRRSTILESYARIGITPTVGGVTTTFAGNILAVDGIFSGNVSGVEGTFTGNIILTAGDAIIKNTVDANATQIFGGSATNLGSGIVLRGSGNANYSAVALALRTGGVDRMTFDSIGNATFSGVAKIGDDTGFGTPSTSVDDLLIYNQADAGITIFSDTGFGGIYFADKASVNVGRIRYIHSDNSMRVVVNSLEAYIIYSDTGVVFGGASGGNKGAGRINAKGVYDDGTILTCYVPLAAKGEELIDSEWDAMAADDVTPAIIDRDGKIITKEKTSKTKHEGYHKFKARLGTEYDPLDIDKYTNHWKEKNHLTSMPSKEKWKNKDLGIGEWVQRLIETVEIQAVHIDKLNQRVKTLEAKT